MSSADSTATSPTVEFAIPADEIDRYFDWQPCAAFRFVHDGDVVRFQFALTDDDRDRYRQALLEIANAESGPWGRIAFDALHPERAR